MNEHGKKKKCVRCGIDCRGYACRDCIGIDTATTRAWSSAARAADQKRKERDRFMDYVFEKPETSRRRGMVEFA